MKPYFDIQLHITDESSLYNPLDPSGMTFSGDIYDYISDCYTDKHIGEIPRIIVGADSPIDTDRLMNAFRSYVDSELERKYRERKIEIAKLIRLLCIGVAFLVIWVILENTLNAVGTEILSIIGSFAVWEAASIGIVNMPEIRHQILLLKQLTSMEVIIK